MTLDQWKAMQAKKVIVTVCHDTLVIYSPILQMFFVIATCDIFRRVPSSTCGKLARDLMLTPSGKRQPPTRRRMRKRMTKKRRRPSSTSRDRLARRSSTSTSPSPTRVDVVVVGIVDVVVAAAAKDVDAVAAVVVMEKDVPHTGTWGV